MKAETNYLIQRPYQDVVDDILVGIVGGVVNEPIIFDLRIDLYPLAQPADDVRGITGQRGGVRYTFQKSIDFVFSAGDNAIIWQEGAVWPDDESIFYVDYFRRATNPPLTDINVGSVTRTLSEAIGREIATVYEQINLAYLSGFVDTAQGKSLDLVVAILGLKRRDADHARGLVTFFRDPTMPGNITIPEGTKLTTQKGDVLFEVTELRTLQRGQVRVDAPVQATNDFKGPVGNIDAGLISVMTQPVAGISRVTNLEKTLLGIKDETDDELRARAKAKLRALGKGTLAALIEVIQAGGANLVEIWDPNSAVGKQTEPGSVYLTIESEPERFPSLQAGIEQTRAAGVRAVLVAKYVFIKLRVVARITPNLPPAGKLKVLDQIIEALRAYIDGLERGVPATAEAMIKVCTDLDDVKPFKKDFRIVDVLTWQSDIGRPAAATMVDKLLEAIQTTPPGDATALREALTRTVEGDAQIATPSGRRIPNPDLVQNKAGSGRATYTEIEKGEFQVVSTISGEPWWAVLDMERADILLLEG